MNDKGLIILVRNPNIGCVKTRLAADIGEESALTVYKVLIEHTRSISLEVPCARLLFYSDYIDENDLWEKEFFIKFLQKGSDFGEKMLQAFRITLQRYRKAVIIGSDCLELTARIINEAFDQLLNYDVVLGPAKDGGYYLMGLKEIHQELFINKKWSTSSVFSDTIADINKLGIKYFLLPTLSDIDVLDDLKNSKLSNKISFELPD